MKPPTPVLQSETAECGLACLAMVSAAHGSTLSLAQLRRRFTISQKGVNLGQLMRHAHALGFASRPLKLDLQDLSSLQIPCVLHWDLNHFVVLVRVTRREVTILDPAIGKRLLSMADVSNHFTGIALELTPTLEFKTGGRRENFRLRDLIGRIYGLKRAVLAVVMLAVGLETLALSLPLVTQWVVDGALVSGDRDLLLLTVMAGGTLISIQFLLNMARGWITLRMNQQLSIQFTTNLFSHLLKLPLAFFEKRHIGDITSRFSSLQTVRSILTEGSVSAVLDGAMAILTLCMMVLYSGKLALVVAIALTIYALFRLISFSAFREANEQRILLAAKESSYFLETIRAVQPLKLFNRTSERLARWQNMMVDVQSREFLTQRMELAFGSSNRLIFGLEAMLLLYIGGSAVISQELTLGMLLAFVAYKEQFTTRATSLIDLGMRVKMLALHAERVADIAVEPPERDSEQKFDVERIEATIEICNVSFRYAEGEPWVLRNCSMKIQAGEHVAITGVSGSGKSTLLKLIIGVLEPTEGYICVGGIKTSQLSLTQLRTLMGVVMQNDTLLAGSLLENIACFDQEPDQSRAEHVAKLAQIHDDIQEMPMGYLSLVGDMGSSLSGGQQQRILIARALYKDSRMLLLDEATSNLDIRNEFEVNEAVKALPLTRVTIAHRSATVKSADRVVVLSNGGAVSNASPASPLIGET